MVNKIPQKQGKVGYKSPPKETQFKPGKSGNPGGLPKGTPKVSVALMKLLAGDPREKFTPATRAEQIALSLYNRASTGEVSVIKEIADRTEGKAPIEAKSFCKKIAESFEINQDFTNLQKV